MILEKKNKQELENARKKLAIEIDNYVKALGNLLKPLKDLNESQIAALIALGFSIRIIMLVRRPTTRIDEMIFKRFKEVIDDICPPLGKVTISKDPCFDATVSYLSSLKQCQHEGRDEDKCFEAWEPGAQALNCTMKELDRMKKQLLDIFERLNPPIPFQWPK